MKIFTAFALFLLSFSLSAQHTFSIVAIDTITGEVGSAGASCLDDITFPGSGGAIIMSDLLPGRGAIHTQSFWLEANQNNARLKMQEGLAPDEILLWLKQNDPEGLVWRTKKAVRHRRFRRAGAPALRSLYGQPASTGKGIVSAPTTRFRAIFYWARKS